MLSSFAGSLLSSANLREKGVEVLNPRKIAFQTILWGNRLSRPHEVFRMLAEHGFAGVEIAQPPSLLPPARELERLLHGLGLQIVGLCGGEVAERMDYCDGLTVRPHYLYVEHCTDEMMATAQERGYRLALHPHVFKKTSHLAQATELLQRFPDLLFLPDTAHEEIVRDVPCEAIAQALRPPRGDPPQGLVL